MKFTELFAFDVAPGDMQWPWFAFDATGTRFACASGANSVACYSYDGGSVVLGPSFELPVDVPVSSIAGFALHRDGAQLAIVANGDKESWLVVCGPGAAVQRRSLCTLVDKDDQVQAKAVAYDRKGECLWLVATCNEKTLVVRVDAATHSLAGLASSAGFPEPAVHEIYVHPVDDAILLLASCGQYGTFARVVGFSGETVESVTTALDEGGVPAGFVGFSADAARVHLAEADELRTHAWPALFELSSVELADDFVSSYAGAVFGEHVLVDGELADAGGDAVMRFDAAALRGTVLSPPVPEGMWAGRIGRDAIIVVDAKASPKRASVLRLALPDTRN
jgi:hypothetical protein